MKLNCNFELMWKWLIYNMKMKSEMNDINKKVYFYKIFCVGNSENETIVEFLPLLAINIG